MLFNTLPTYRLIAAALSIAALAAPGAAGEINSNLQIDPGQTFELGGGQRGSFTVAGRNTGPVAVVVYALPEGARAPVERGTVAPGASLDAVFARGEQALLRNTSTMEMARLKLKVTGDTAALGMAYSANR